MSFLLALLLSACCASASFASTHDSQMVELAQRGRVFPPLHAVGLSLSQAVEEGEVSVSPLAPEADTPPTGVAPPPPSTTCKSIGSLFIKASRGPECLRGSKLRQCVYGGTVGTVCFCEAVGQHGQDYKYRQLGRAIGCLACSVYSGTCCVRGYKEGQRLGALRYRGYPEPKSRERIELLRFIGGLCGVFSGIAVCACSSCRVCLLRQADRYRPEVEVDTVEPEVASPTVIDVEDSGIEE